MSNADFGRDSARIPCMLVTALLLGACGGATTQAGAGAGIAEDAGPVGSINAEFDLPSGSVSTASYRLTGPGVSQASTLDFQGSQIVGFLFTGLPAASGYSLALTATDDGGESCMGSTSFDVTAGKTAMVTVTATCSGGPFVPSGFGMIEVWTSLPQGLQMSQATCTLTGPAGVEVAGQPLDWSETSGLMFTLADVPAGSGQVLEINGTATNGDYCEASTTVTVTADQTAQAMLPLHCVAPAPGSDD